MARHVTPIGADSNKLGDVPDEPRQWCAFEFADLMEQGLSGGTTASYIELSEEEVRLCVERSPDRKEYLLRTPDGALLLLARLNDNGGGFSIFVTGDGEPPRALGPAFTLESTGAQDRWQLCARTCDRCEKRGRRACGSRELGIISHHMEELENGAQACCLDMEIPAITQEGIPDVWCPMCKGSDLNQQFVELTTRRPKWNSRRKTLSLDFFGRCSVASSKNFQLEVVGKPQKLKLLYGKVGPNKFVLDFNRPLGMVQAFAAAISTSVWK
jgi:hypothetical protein